MGRIMDSKLGVPDERPPHLEVVPASTLRSSARARRPVWVAGRVVHYGEVVDNVNVSVLA